MMSARASRFALTLHVLFSVGWLGAVAVFLALSIVGLTSMSETLVRGAYLAMNVTALYVIVPLSLASFVSGIVQSLGTPWGLFRHYWVVAKLLITTVSTALLILHLQPIGHLASVVAETTPAKGDLAGMRIQLVATSAAAVVALVVATALSIYKPRGLTPHGWRKQQEQRLS